MATPTEEEIERVISGYDRASAAPGYVDSIVCEMQQVSGDNYEMVWSNEYNGNFEPNR